MNFENIRNLMVENQLRPNLIKDSKIIELFKTTPKENFLPENLKNFAYSDIEISINENRKYLSNIQIAKMLQSIKANQNNTILHIGALSGYVSSLLSKIASKVIAIEKDEKLYNELNENIKLHNINNIKSINCEHEEGYKKGKPFDVIFIDSVVEYLPNNILDQLKNENGKIITIKKINENLSKGIIMIKNFDSYFTEKIFDSFSKASAGFKKNDNFKF